LPAQRFLRAAVKEADDLHDDNPLVAINSTINNFAFRCDIADLTLSSMNEKVLYDRYIRFGGLSPRL